jgi:alpha-glutamyl/putrescinyl thymine pyrophosphorylase clade 1
VERQEEEFVRLNLPFSGLFGRKLHGIDCQGLFCELDKYCREAVPELISARCRIKAKYVAAQENINLFFPPKWDLPSGAVVKTTGVQSQQVAHKRRKREADCGSACEQLAIADLFG